MQRRRTSAFLLIVAVVVALALAVQRLGPPRGGGPTGGGHVAAADLRHVGGDVPSSVAAAAAPTEVVRREAERLLGRDRRGQPTFELDLATWRAFADAAFERRHGGPVTIGDVEMDPGAFDRFGAAALDPSGWLVAFTATAYAMLTTVSVVTILDTRTGTLAMVEEPAYGEVDAFVWDPSGTHVASTASTARAGGDLLRVDDVAELRTVREVDGGAVLQALATATERAEPDVDPRDYLPRFRDPTWLDAQTLRITVDDPWGDDLLHLAFDVATEQIRPLR